MFARVLLIFFIFLSSFANAQTVTVYFDFNSFMLNNETKRTLTQFIAQGEIKSVGFFGHTDQMGTNEYNEWLSVQRALAVKDFFISKGLKESEVSVVRGFGAARLVTTEPDSASMQLNRRVAVTTAYKPTAADLAAVAKQVSIHYGPSPNIIKPPQTVAASDINPGINKTEQNTVTQAAMPKDNFENKPVAPVVKPTITKQEAKKPEQNSDAKTIASGENAENKTVPPVVTGNSTNSEAKVLQQNADIKIAETKAATENKPPAKVATENKTPANTGLQQVTSGENANNDTKNEMVISDKKSEGTESFADRLSKTVNKNSSTGTNAVLNAPTSKANAPVVKAQKNEKLIEDIRDKTTKAGEHIVLRNIHFYGGRHAFLPAAYSALDDLLETMQKVPTLEIEIQGHVCCHEGDGDEIDFDSGEPVLSVTRAKAVYDFLVENGVDRKRISYVGLAHKFPLIKVETSEADATINRRVEIKIIRK